MGTPAPKEFSLWILKNNTVEGVQAYDLIDKQVIEKQLEELAPISLSLQPQKIAYRPVYFWHGQLDPIVPFHLTKSFIDEIKNEAFSENIVFDVSENVGHEVPQTISKKMAEFFKEHENK